MKFISKYFFSASFACIFSAYSAVKKLTAEVAEFFAENRRVFILFVLCLLSTTYCSAQQNKIDSLLSLLKNDKEDTNKVNHLNKISEGYWRNGSYDSALQYCNPALQLSQQLNFKKGIANSYNIVGTVHREQGDYPKALDYYLKALKLDGELKDKSGMAKRFGNIGNIYYQQDDYPKALDYYFEALKIGEELKDKNRIATQLGNIGNIYREQSDYLKALDYYLKALKINEEIGNKENLAANLGSIGSLYRDQARRISSESSGKNSIGKDSLHKKALYYYFKALKMADELGNKNGMAVQLGNIGLLYTEQKKYIDAYTYLYRTLALDDSIGAMGSVKDDYQLLSALYEMSNIPIRDTIGGKLLSMEQMPQRALYYYKRYINLQDTLFSEENKKQLVRKEMNYEFEKKEAAQKAEQEKQAAVAEAGKKKQQIILLSVISCLLLVVVFAGFIFRALRITRKQKLLIEEQKKVVEEKQKEILDSIHYAKRIQTALLPMEKYIDRTLKRLMKK